MYHLFSQTPFLNPKVPRHMSLHQHLLLLMLVVPWFTTGLFARDTHPQAVTPDESSQGPIDQAGFVTIGGIEQWITIKGENRANPVILFVHGGPGNPMSLWSESLYQNWESAFTVVQWDQRFSGKTYERNESIVEWDTEHFHQKELTVERLAADGIEVTEYLIQHLQKNKVILTGTSWGSLLAVHMIQQRPEHFHAYVGVSQLVSGEHNLRSSYEQTLQRARSKNDTAAITTLEELGPPPWRNPRNFGKLRRIVYAYEREKTSEDFKLVAGADYQSEAYQAAYTAGEDFSFLKFVGLQGDGFLADIDLPSHATHFEIPIFILQGAEDLLTTPDVTQSYFDTISAPEKQLILVDQAGHDPNIAMIERQLKVMKNQVVPLIRESKADR